MGFAALGCSIGAVICYLICYKMTTERVKIEQETEKFNLLALLKYLLTNRALIGIIVAAIMLLLAQLSLSSMAQYIYPNYFRSSAAISASNLGTSVLTIALAAVMPPLVQKFGKKELSIFGALLGAAALIVGYILHTDNVVLFVVINLIAFLGIAFFNVSCWAMITDVIDDAEVRTGKRADGTIYATYSFARKLGQAASSGLTGGLLSLIGYSAATQFDQNVVDGIYNITCIVPAGGFILLALALIFIYPLSKKRVDANIAALKAKREQ